MTHSHAGTEERPGQWALDAIGQSLSDGFGMFWETLWALVVGFALSGAVQAFVSRAEMQRALGDHRPATIAKASFFGTVSSSCSYAASALATRHAGTTVYFCSDHCRHRFTSEPERFARGMRSGATDAASGEHGHGAGQAQDLVCGMSVDVAHPGDEASAAGRRYVFCGPGCAQAFNADPQRYLTGRQRAEASAGRVAPT